MHGKAIHQSGQRVQYAAIRFQPGCGQRRGRLVNLSGQVGVDAQERLAGHDLATQTRAALENVRLVLEAAGGELGHVVMLRLYLVERARQDQG